MKALVIRKGNFGDVVIDEASEATNAAGSGSSGSPPSADDQNESSGTRDNIKEEIPYLLVYKSTFHDQKISPKNRPRLIHESHTKT